MVVEEESLKVTRLESEKTRSFHNCGRGVDRGPADISAVGTISRYKVCKCGTLRIMSNNM